jgi:hypothetical protein
MIYKNILQSFKDWRELRRLNKMIKKAEKLHLKTGKQYLIVPFDLKGHFILVHGSSFLNEYNIRAKKMGIKKMTYPDMLERAYYKTGNGTLNKR